MNKMMQCPGCFGRGYKPEARKPSKRNPCGNGFYARTCPRCRGSGQIEEPAKMARST
jgi:DnaJ-class molecular chaperone